MTSGVCLSDLGRFSDPAGRLVSAERIACSSSSSLVLCLGLCSSAECELKLLILGP